MCNLVDETICLAKASTWPVTEICQAAGIKPRWYYAFLAGRFADPGVNKVLRLNRVLKAQGRVVMRGK